MVKNRKKSLAKKPTPKALAAEPKPQATKPKNLSEDLTWLKKLVGHAGRFFKQNWIGTVIILAATLLFFAPFLPRLDSYSEGGDAMFNAWTLARNHHCILGQDCANYSDANIYFPHKDTMLYSETQASAGLLTLPLFLINDNPIFAYNVWTILSVFFGAWFMYLLAKRLSGGNEWVSVLAGLIFAFAPFKMAAIFHLQNLSIFYLPLATLLIIKFFDTQKKSYLWGLLATLILLFYASWYNLVFAATALAVFVAFYWLFKLAKFRQVLAVAGIVALAALSTLPLALEFTRFSKESGANFSLNDQLLYQSSLMDYFLPHEGTIVGNIFYTLNPGERHNAFNLDSYSYHGVILYALAGALIVLVFLNRKKSADAFKKYGAVISFAAVGFVGLILSLGPLLKIKGNYIYGSTADGIGVAIPMPYLLIDKLIPQLTFIRGVGRWSVLFLFALCCLLAFFAYYLAKNQKFKRYHFIIAVLVTAVVIIELAPIHFVTFSKNEYSQNLKVPEVYRFIKARPEINNLIVLRGDEDYKGAPIPIARAEDVLWAGYHNRNIFNGYSGYTPPEYFNQYWDFIDLAADDIPKMKQLGLQYVVVDKQLSHVKNTSLEKNAKNLLPNKLYEDERYALFSLPQ